MFKDKEILEGVDALLVAVAEMGYNLKRLEDKIEEIHNSTVAHEQRLIEIFDYVIDKDEPKSINEKADAAYFDKKSGLYSSKKMRVKEE
jgi:hypothetical protein